ncbi:MAG: SAM-dependent chlorinase/fluorinase [Magnetococcus sp. YQC-5]
MITSMPVILLTDFGSSDPYVGQMKGVILRHAPHTILLDLYHEIPPFAIKSGAWLLERCLAHMPKPAVWLCVVDPGVGSERRGLVVQAEGSFFVGPDNGLLTPVLLKPETRIVELKQPNDRNVSATFHGRDIFAPVAAQLLHGQKLDTLGHALTSPPVTLTDPGWCAMNQEWQTEVILVDRYGNLITPLPGVALQGKRVTGWINGQACGPLVTTFSSVAPGNSALVVGGFSTLEVMVNQGSAAERFACGSGAQLRLLEVAS